MERAEELIGGGVIDVDLKTCLQFLAHTSHISKEICFSNNSQPYMKDGGLQGGGGP